MRDRQSLLALDLPPDVVAATEAFTDEELLALRANYDVRTGEFIGVFFQGPGDVYCRYANVDKYEAMLVLEDQIRKELGLCTS